MDDDGTTARDGSGSTVGSWGVDRHGLPVFHLRVDVPTLTTTPGGERYPLERDPYALLGNDMITAFAHASGRVLLLSGARGWIRLNAASPGHEFHRAELTLRRGGTSSTHTLLGEDGVAARAEQTRRELGCGFVRHDMETGDEVRVERVLSVAPSERTAPGAAPPRPHAVPGALVLTVRITNTGADPVEVEHVESLLSRPMAGRRRDQAATRPVDLVTEATLLPDGAGVVSTATAVSDDPGLLTGPEEPNRHNLYPPDLALLAGPAGTAPVRFSHRAADGGGTWLEAATTVTLPPGSSTEVVLVVGLVHEGETTAGLGGLARSLPSSDDGRYFGQEWRAALGVPVTVPDETLRSELTWDSHALLAMATYSAYHGHTFIPQGMTYDYHMEMTAAPRDHLQHAMAAAYVDPALARSTILYTLCKMTYQGEIKYMDFGNGETSNSAWNTSDQQLYLFQALGEYLRITGDASILDERTPYLPKEAAFTGTTLEKVERAFAYLRDEVAVGSHGLIRLMNSDWSDMVFVDVSVHRYFGGAESQMNTAMAMAVLPTLIEQLERLARPSGTDVDRTERLLASMRRYTERVTAAMLRDMEGRDFARRVYLDADTPLGDTTMDLEPQSFLLQAASFDADRKRVLWREMQERLLDGEALGPRQREKPVVGGLMEPGVSENGGFWYALAGQAIAGVATFDADAAHALLDRMTMRNAARRYPDYWVGHWSGPDTVNAEYCGDLAGLPRPDNGGLWRLFPMYCAHVHAWPIYAWFRIRELAD